MNNTKIVIVNGHGSVGKTSWETMVQKIAAARNKRVEILSTITYVKQFAKEMGWNGGKTEKDRRFLSDLKDALTRWKDIPYNETRMDINQLEEDGADLIFIDCREPEEIKRFVNDYNALTVLVQRGEMIIMGNHADDNVLNYQYDITIDNSRGLDELMQEATIFVETFLEDDI